MQDVTIDRYKYIGGSDIPCIMEISPFKKRFDLLLEKAQLKENEFAGNEYTEYGNILEPKIREHINVAYNKNFVEDKIIIDDKRYHADGYDGETVLEIKTTSQIHSDVNDYKVYLVQLLFGMSLYGLKNGILAVYERPEDFNTEFDADRLTVYEIDINDYVELINSIYIAIDRFRTDLQNLKENPLLTEQELLSTELVALGEKLVALENQLAAYKAIEAQQKEVKATLLQAMIEHNVKKWTTNNGVQITRVDATSDKIEMVFDEKTFKANEPEMYKSYTVEKVKNGRAAYVKITLPKGA